MISIDSSRPRASIMSDPGHNCPTLWGQPRERAQKKVEFAVELDAETVEFFCVPIRKDLTPRMAAVVGRLSLGPSCICNSYKIFLQSTNNPC